VAPSMRALPHRHGRRRARLVAAIAALATKTEANHAPDVDLRASGGVIRVRDVPGRGCVFTIDLPTMPLAS
jgi:hypothetical protein